MHFSPHSSALFFIAFRERDEEGRETERNRNVNVSDNQLVAFSYMPGLGIETTVGMHPDQESKP